MSRQRLCGPVQSGRTLPSFRGRNGQQDSGVCLCLIKHHAKNAYRQLHPFLTWLDRFEWSVSRPGRSTSRARTPNTQWIGSRGWTLWRRDNSLPGIKLQFLSCPDRGVTTTDCPLSAFPATKNWKEVVFIYTATLATSTLVNKITSHQQRHFFRSRVRTLLESSTNKLKEYEYYHIYKETVCVRIECAVLSGYMQHKLIDRTEF